MTKNEIKELLMKHHQKYPLMSLDDDYKLMHQVIFGPKHFMLNPHKEKVLNYLEHELNEMDLDDHHQVFEPIGNGFYRVYLNCLSLNVITKDELIDAFYRSMHLDLGEQDKLIKDMDDALAIVKEMTQDKNFTGKMAELKTKGYPAVHHSETYRNHYQPHYRVIHESCLNEKIRGELNR